MARMDLGLKELARRTQKVASGKDAVKKGLTRLGQVVLTRAKQLTPVDGGYLRSQWFMEVTANAVYIENLVSYAAYVNYGYRMVREGRTVGFVPPVQMLELALLKTAKYDLKNECERMLKEMLEEFQ